MMISNQTKNTKITSKIKTCKGFFSTGWGLMFRKTLKPGEGMLLDLHRERQGGIHTIFVFFPIDVVWLNNKEEVVDIRESVSPFTFYIAPKEKARYILELPKGSIKKSKTGVGDKLTLYSINKEI